MNRRGVFLGRVIFTVMVAGTGLASLGVESRAAPPLEQVTVREIAQEPTRGVEYSGTLAASTQSETNAPPMTVESESVPLVLSGTRQGNDPVSGCCTGESREAATDKMKGAYKGLFYANDFSYLNDPCYDGPSFLGESLKGLAENRLNVGGEARVRYHSENNFRGRVPGLRGANPSGLGLTTNDDEFWLTRLRLFADYKIKENFRVYGEYLYADSAGETF